MVDLPETPDEVVTSRTPETRVSPGEVAAPYAMLSNTLDKMAGVAETTAEKYGEEAGQAAVTRGPNGQPVIAKSLIIGPASEAYARAARFEYLTQLTPQIATTVEQMKIDHALDPEGMATAAKTYTKGLMDRTPDPALRAAVEKTVLNATTPAVVGAMSERDEVTRRNALEGMKNALTQNSDESVTLARQGLATPEQQQAYNAKVADRDALIDNIVKDPRNGWTKERGEAAKKDARDNDTGWAIVGESERLYTSKKDKVEAQQFLYEHLWGPGSEKLSLTARQRDKFMAEGLHALAGISTEERAELKDFHATLNSWSESIIKAPANYDPTQTADLRKKAVDLGDYASVNHIDAMSSSIDAIKNLRRMDEKQRGEFLGTMTQGFIPTSLSPAKVLVNDVIAHAEAPHGGWGKDPVTGQPIRTGFGSTVGGDEFDPNDPSYAVKHPYAPGQKYLKPYRYTNPNSPYYGQISTASGRGQEIQGTYEESAAKYGIYGFSPEAQLARNFAKADDLYSHSAPERRYPGATGNLEKDVEKFGADPNFWSNAFAPAARKEWTSVPGGEQPNGYTQTWVQNAVARSQGQNIAPPDPVNMAAADRALGLTPEEKALYQRHLDVLRDPKQRVELETGDVATLYQITVDHDGKTYSIPTVYDGKILSVEDATKRAEQAGWDKFPAYSSPDEAQRRYDAIHAYMDKDAAAFAAARQEIKEHPTPPGTGVRIATMPQAQQRLFMSLRNELQQNAAKNATAAIEDINKRLKDGQIVSVDSLSSAIELAKLGGKEDDLKTLGELLTSRQLAERVDTPEKLAAAKMELDRQQHSGAADPVAVRLQEGMVKAADDQQNMLKKDVMTAAQQSGDYNTVPLNTQDPNAVLANLQSRQKQIDYQVGRHGTAVAEQPSAFTEAERPAYAALLKSGPVAEGRNLIEGASAALSPNAFQGTFSTPEAKDALISAANGQNPDRMNTAMRAMDKMKHTNPHEFNRTFGDDMSKKLDAWTVLKDQITDPELLVKRLNMPNDPEQKDSYAALKVQVDKEVTDMKGNEALKLLRGWHLPFMGDDIHQLPGSAPQASYLQSDFTSYYKNMRTYGLDEQTSAKLAGDYVKTKWTVSGVNGGALTRDAPESFKANAPIGGDQTWMQDSLKRDVTAILGPQELVPGKSGVKVFPKPPIVGMAFGSGFFGTLGEYEKPLNWRIVGTVTDHRTMAEAGSGVPPTFEVYVERNGVIEKLRAPNGKDRFWFDRDAAVKEDERKRTETTRINDAQEKALEGSYSDPATGMLTMRPQNPEPEIQEPLPADLPHRPNPLTSFLKGIAGKIGAPAAERPPVIKPGDIVSGIGTRG